LGYTIGMNSNTLNALAEPNRLRIVELLREGPCSVGEISKRLYLRQPQTSKHLRVLSDTGLVVVKPAANQRIYALRPEPFQELDMWVETFRHLWSGRLDTLNEYMQELKQQKKRDNE
jgi:DNA-binding transcriptional ArsR family regulator